MTKLPYRLWVNEERTFLVRLWSDGVAHICTRKSPEDIWGSPIVLGEESE